jgi:hypothetical protein
MAKVSPRNIEGRVASQKKLSPVARAIMKQYGVTASAAIKADKKFKELEVKTQKTGKDKIYSFDQKGLNYSKATKNLLKNQ